MISSIAWKRLLYAASVSVFLSGTLAMVCDNVVHFHGPGLQGVCEAFSYPWITWTNAMTGVGRQDATITTGKEHHFHGVSIGPTLWLLVFPLFITSLLIVASWHFQHQQTQASSVPTSTFAKILVVLDSWRSQNQVVFGSGVNCSRPDHYVGWSSRFGGTRTRGGRPRPALHCDLDCRRRQSCGVGSYYGAGILHDPCRATVTTTSSLGLVPNSRSAIAYLGRSHLLLVYNVSRTHVLSHLWLRGNSE